MGDDSVVLARYTPKIQPESDSGSYLGSNGGSSGRHSNGTPSNGGDNVSEHTVKTDKHVINDVTVEESQEAEESGPCGWGPFSFLWCQRFRDPKWFVLVLTLCGACQVSLSSLYTMDL